MQSRQRLYNGVRFPMDGPSLSNVAKIDDGARPYIHHCMTRGMRVDLSHFARMEKVLIEDMDRITEEVKAMTGVYVNLDSGDQVSALLFKKLGLKQARPKMTKSGDRESVENEVLVAVQHDHPVVPKILNFKELSKLKGTYVSPMPKLAAHVGHDHWRMFPKLGDTRVPSGRLNCKEPNLLAMPNRTRRGREICEGFITEDGWTFLSVDESQIEPRVVAHRSQDPALMAVYFNEEDIYSDFAISAFQLKDERHKDATGWHYPGVDKKLHRFPSKTCILAAIYDVTNIGLLEQMPTVCRNCQKEATLHDCDTFAPLWNEDNCQSLLTAFYRRYPALLPMRRRDHARARKFGYLWDEWGRLLHVTAVRSVLEWVVSSALREAGNFPIQSTAQGTVKLTMAAVYDDMEAGSMFDVAHPVLQIHDELLFECRQDFAEELGAHVQWRFETCVELDVPIKAGVAMAETWGAMPK
jgi:DNA polymerase-1